MIHTKPSPSRVSEDAFLAMLRSGGVEVTRHRLTDGSEALAFRPEGAFACLALCHGGGNDRLYGFWGLVEELVGKGISIVTVDMPGHGAGGVDRFSVDGARRRLDDLVRLAAEMADPVVVLGQSMGGAFALDQWLRGTSAQAIIAVSVPVRIDLGLRSLLELAAVVEPEVWRVLRYVPLTHAWPALGPFGRERFPVRLLSDEGYVSAFRRTLVELDLLERLSSVDHTQPVLLVHGERDGVAPYRGALEWRKAIGDSASLLSVPGGNHFDLLLRRSVVAAVSDWLNKVAGRPC